MKKDRSFLRRKRRAVWKETKRRELAGNIPRKWTTWSRLKEIVAQIVYVMRVTKEQHRMYKQLIKR
jgi:hypothetical protein